MMDLRNKNNRREGFLQLWRQSTLALDVDPALWMINYLNDRYEHNQEERLWLAWLYHTYRLPTTWVLKQEFPDYELATVNKFERFVEDNYYRIRHERDTKWTRGKLPEMFKSYSEWVGDRTQQESFDDLLSSDPESNFWALWDLMIKRWHRFGRYTAFFIIQTYEATCGLPVKCPSLFLNDYKGSKSHRDGLLLALGQDDKIGARLDSTEINNLERVAKEMVREAQERWPELSKEFNLFTMETELCAWKKFFRVKNGRYVNYYNDRVADNIRIAEGDGWIGVDWKVLHQCREEVSGGRLKPCDTIDPGKMSLFLDTGTFEEVVQL
jgi:hypothetical protein